LAPLEFTPWPFRALDKLRFELLRRILSCARFLARIKFNRSAPADALKKPEIAHLASFNKIFLLCVLILAVLLLLTHLYN